MLYSFSPCFICLYCIELPESVGLYPPTIWKNCSHYVFKYLFCLFLFLSSFWNSIYTNTHFLDLFTTHHCCLFFQNFSLILDRFYTLSSRSLLFPYTTESLLILLTQTNKPFFLIKKNWVLYEPKLGQLSRIYYLIKKRVFWGRNI